MSLNTISTNDTLFYSEYKRIHMHVATQALNIRAGYVAADTIRWVNVAIIAFSISIPERAVGTSLAG